MRKKKYKPNLFLKRELFYENCTVGSLWVLHDVDDNRDRFISHTMEPRWRDLANGERKIVGRTCIPAGIYPIEFSYEDHLKYKCPRLKMTTGFINIRICFISKSGSKPRQTQGNILLGFVHQIETVLNAKQDAVTAQGGGDDATNQQTCEPLAISNFDGTLYSPAIAFKRLKDYFEKLRANKEEMVLEIKDGDSENWHPTILPKIEDEQTEEVWDDEDFMMATL